MDITKNVVCNIKEGSESLIIKLRSKGKVFYKEIDYNNYFFIDFDDEYLSLVEKFPTFIERVERFDGRNGQFIKVVVKNNYYRYIVKAMIEELYDGIKFYEIDMNGVKRWLLHNQKTPLHQEHMRYVTLDIETDDRKPFRFDEKGKMIMSEPILSIAMKLPTGEIWFKRNQGLDGDDFAAYRLAYMKLTENRDDEEAKKVIESFEESAYKSLVEGEKKLLHQWWKDSQIVDAIIGWNLAGFDAPYLRTRCEFHGLNYESLFFIELDFMLIYKKNKQSTPLASYSLESVSRYEFEKEVGKSESKFKLLSEVTKIDWRQKTKCKKYYELFLLHKDLFKEYNVQDCHLLWLIEEKLNLLKLHQVEANMCHCFLPDTTYNSKMCDMLMLNECYNRNIVSPSKPTKEEFLAREDPKTGTFAGGGYTYCYEKGFHKKVWVFDFKSDYTTTIITYNISPETYVTSVRANLKSVFTDKEGEYIQFCERVAEQYLNAKGELQKKKYEEAIEAKRLEFGLKKTMEDLMWQFVEQYKSEKLTNYCKEKNYVYTPADINFDTRGWKVHPHYIFKREEQGIFPIVCERLIIGRDETKDEMKKFEKGTPEWQALDLKQNGLKTLGNSVYGFAGFKRGRYYKFGVTDAITSEARYKMKRVISFVRKNGFVVTSGDSVSKDSVVIIDGKKMKIEDFWNSLDVDVEYVFDKEIRNILSRQFSIEALRIKNSPFDRIRYPGKFNMRGYAVKSHISKIIRHKTHKKMFRITLESGKHIDVTEDHSTIIRRNDVIQTILTKDVKLGDLMYVKSESGFCKLHTSWNKGMKPKDWMSKEQYEKWCSEKKQNTAYNRMGANKGMSATEKIAYDYLKDYGFEYDVDLYITYRYIPDFLHREKKIIIEINGSSHLNEYDRQKDLRKKEFFEKQGYDYRIIEINEKKSRSLSKNIKNIILAKLEEVTRDLSKN